MKRKSTPLMVMVPFNHDIFHYVALHLGPLDLIHCSIVCKEWLSWVDGAACRGRWDEIFKQGIKGRFIREHYEQNHFGRREFAPYNIRIPRIPSPEWFLSNEITYDQKLTLIAGEVQKFTTNRECMIAFPKIWEPNGERILFSIGMTFEIVKEGVSMLCSQVREVCIPRDNGLLILFIPYIYWISTGRLIIIQ